MLSRRGQGFDRHFLTVESTRYASFTGTEECVYLRNTMVGIKSLTMSSPGRRTAVCLARVRFTACVTVPCRIFLFFTAAFAAAVYCVSGCNNCRLSTWMCVLYGDYIASQSPKSRQDFPLTVDTMLPIKTHSPHVCVAIPTSSQRPFF